MFELKLEQELLELEKQLKTGTYKHGGYTKFKIYEPKERIIMASEYKDRVVHQWYVEKFIKPYFVPQFISTSYAGIEGRGMHKASKDVQKAMRSAKSKWKNYYILKMDVTKYFQNIDKRILWEILKRKMKDKKLLWLTREILLSTEGMVGLPLGNYTSQMFANIYLNELDQYVKHILKCKYYYRYMDDIVIMCENKKIAERYGNIENLTVGMLYEYGIVDFDFLRKQLCKYMNEIITEEELRDIFFTRMNLNRFVNDYNIKWTNTNEVQYFVTYLDEEYSPIDIGEIAEEQKARKMKYKQFSKQELLKREEYLYDERAKKLYKFLKSKNDNIYEWTFKRLLKNNELGIDILGDLSNMCMFADDIELKKFMDLFTDWYNNSPQYMLGGYSPIEFRKTFK